MNFVYTRIQSFNKWLQLSWVSRAWSNKVKQSWWKEFLPPSFSLTFYIRKSTWNELLVSANAFHESRADINMVYDNFTGRFIGYQSFRTHIRLISYPTLWTIRTQQIMTQNVHVEVQTASTSGSSVQNFDLFWCKGPAIKSPSETFSTFVHLNSPQTFKENVISYVIYVVNQKKQWHWGLASW